LPIGSGPAKVKPLLAVEGFADNAADIHRRRKIFDEVLGKFKSVRLRSSDTVERRVSFITSTMSRDIRGT